VAKHKAMDRFADFECVKSSDFGRNCDGDNNSKEGEISTELHILSTVQDSNNNVSLILELSPTKYVTSELDSENHSDDQNWAV
jgi:hypothetical protein